MEASGDIDEEKEMKQPFLNHPSNHCQGRLRTLPFILGNEAFERAGYFGLEPNMIVYLMGSYGLEMATGSNIIFLWSAATNFTPILGAFIADSYVGRFSMIAFGSIFSLMGMMLLWSTTIIPGARPVTGGATNISSSATPLQLTLLFASFGLMSIGTGGIRSSTLAFGADQLAGIGDDVNAKPTCGGVLESFFSWYYFSLSFSVLFALTFVVYIQDHAGWQVGFGVPTLLMLVSVLLFFFASSLYFKVKPPRASLFTRFAQVLVAAWRNRNYEFPNHSDMDTVYHVVKGSTLEVPSEKLRFLNKACIVMDPRQDYLTPDGMVVDPWRLCCVDQVEDFKSVINIIPLWSTGILLGVSSNTTSIRVLQAISMDRHVLTSNFEIPPGSFGTFALITLMLWLVLYDRVIIPLASKAMGKPIRLNVRTRMGIGLLLSLTCMVVSGVVESIRRDMAIRGGRMSALWLVPQVCLFGLAEAFAAIAQIEFFYSEFPRSMSSIASNLFGLSMGFASLVASVIMSVVDHVTRGFGKESWVASDINKGHYDYYYWILAGLSLLNYVYFVFCSRAYDQGKRTDFHEAKETSDVDA